MITKEQERLNELAHFEEMRSEIEAVISKHLNRCPVDLMIGALESSKLKISNFNHHMVIENMKKKGEL